MRVTIPKMQAGSVILRGDHVEKLAPRHPTRSCGGEVRDVYHSDGVANRKTLPPHPRSLSHEGRGKKGGEHCTRGLTIWSRSVISRTWRCRPTDGGWPGSKRLPRRNEPRRRKEPGPARPFLSPICLRRGGGRRSEPGHRFRDQFFLHVDDQQIRRRADLLHNTISGDAS